MRSGSQVTGLLVGQREGGQLLYRGTVEWGLFRQVVTELVASVEGLVRSTSPLADLKHAPSVTWREPRLVAEVSYSELMEDRPRSCHARVARGVLIDGTTPRGERGVVRVASTLQGPLPAVPLGAAARVRVHTSLPVVAA